MSEPIAHALDTDNYNGTWYLNVRRETSHERGIVILLHKIIPDSDFIENRDSKMPLKC